MKIIHCSDLHLDSALRTHLSPEKAKERNAELCASFGRMVCFARQEGVSAVLIAGDLFDSAYASEQTVDYVLEQIRSVPSVTFFTTAPVIFPSSTVKSVRTRFRQ